MSLLGRIGKLTKGRGATGVAPYVLTIGAVVLGWQVAIQPFIQRAPVAVAVRIAPRSPTALSRAAEAELIAGRNENAGFLAREALTYRPFNVRAMRVAGLSEARSGRVQSADDILTLAGNWSLRDDPTHAWLVEQRLRRGSYASSFAHADTLARRRVDLHPRIFALFTTAATEDPQRALPPIAQLLAARPPWRQEYLYTLDDDLRGLAIGISLATLLEKTEAPLSNAELQQFYTGLADRNQISAVKTLRSRINRPAGSELVTNGNFDGEPAPEPFGWILIQRGGATAEISADDEQTANKSLRVEYDGYSTALIARQRLFVEPGRYRLQFSSRTESGAPGDRLSWSVRCGSSETAISSSRVPLAANEVTGKWEATSFTVDIPPACESQWLELRGMPLDRRRSMAIWFDDVKLLAERP